MLQFLVDEVPLFQGLKAEELKPIIPLFDERSYKKGEVIFLEEEEGEEFYIVKSGGVKIYRFDESKEVILDLFSDGDYFGEMAIIEENQARSATAETITATTLYVLKRQDFKKLLTSNASLTMRLLEIALKRIRKANELIHDLTFLDVKSRTYRTILRLTEEHGLPTEQGIVINLQLTHQQLANLVGTVREAVTKVLLELQDEQIISIEKKKIKVLQPTKLAGKLSSL